MNDKTVLASPTSTGTSKGNTITIAPKAKRDIRQNVLFAIDLAVELLYFGDKEEDYSRIYRAISMINLIRPCLTSRVLLEKAQVYCPSLVGEIEQLSVSSGRAALEHAEESLIAETKARLEAEAAAEAASEADRIAKEKAEEEKKAKNKRRGDKEDESKSKKEVAKDKKAEVKKADNTPLLIAVQEKYPELVTVFFQLLLAQYFVDSERYEQALQKYDEVLQTTIVSKRSHDAFRAHAFMQRSQVVEKHGGDSQAVLEEYKRLFPVVTKASQSLTQATLWVCIVRILVLQRKYQSAHEFLKLAAFPSLDQLPSSICAKYLYYRGIVHLQQLEYTEACDHLRHALRKVSSKNVGFVQALSKALICAELAIGIISETYLFRNAQVAAGLVPYRTLITTVYSGDVRGYSILIKDSKHMEFFEQDRLKDVVLRLKASVLRAALKKFTEIYTRLPITTIAERLAIDNIQDAQAVVLKAILDGVIDATMDLEHGVLISQRRAEAATKVAPTIEIRKRIEYCLDLHDQIARSMRYPPQEYLEE